MSKLSQRILVSQCPSMDDLYLDYSSRTFRDRVLVAMEQYSLSQLSEYKEKLKAEIEKHEHKIPNNDFMFGWNKALEKVVLTLIDKI